MYLSIIVLRFYIPSRVHFPVIKEFLAAQSQFEGDQGVDFSVPTCCQSTTFVRPLLAFYCQLMFTKNNNNNAALHFMPRMNAVFG